MEFFVNEGSFFDRLWDYLKAKDCDLYLVKAEYQRPGKNDELTDFKGLDVALELPDDRPLLFCSFMPESYFVKDKEMASKFFALMAKKQVVFLNTINSMDYFYDQYQILINSSKELDLLAIELEKDRREKEVLGKIKHVIGHLSSESITYEQEVAKGIAQAREAGIIGSDEEILEKIMSFEYSKLAGKFSGKYFPGVFCDLEGTLFLSEQINQQLLEELKVLAKTKPITLWTAGNIEHYQEKLLANGIFWKLVSKQDFVGAEVEIAFDDYSYERFQSEFGIKVRNFNQANSYDQEIELKLKFLHALLLPTGVVQVLEDTTFSPILEKEIESKTIREYVREMQEQERKKYDQILVVLRDFLLS